MCTHRSARLRLAEDDHRARPGGVLLASAFELAAPAAPGFAPAPRLALAPAGPPPGGALPCVGNASSNPTSRSTPRDSCRPGSLAPITGVRATGGASGNGPLAEGGC